MDIRLLHNLSGGNKFGGNTMNRLTLVIMGLLILHNTAAADIVNTISKYTQKNPLTVYHINWRLYCQLHISEDNYLFVDSWGELLEPVILAYKITSDTITLILKHTVNDKSKYFYVELKEVKGEIISKYHEINTINLDGFTINGVYIVGNKVNVMLQPSPNAALYDTWTENSEIGGSYLKVTGIKNPREKINNIDDFWYEIEFENKKLWIFGYHITFRNGISLEQKP